MTSIRRRCEKLVKALKIPDPFDAEAFYAQIGAYRGKKLHTLPCSLRFGGPSGFWIGTAAADYIVYEENTSPQISEVWGWGCCWALGPGG